MSLRGDDPNVKTVNAFALAGQLGFSVALPIVVGVAAGTYLGKRTGNQNLFLIGGVLLGIAVGFYSAYRLLARVVGDK